MSDSTSRDKRYGYAVYIDMLLFLLRLSGYPAARTRRELPIVVNEVLRRGKMVKALAADDQIKTIILKDNNTVDALDELLQPIHDKIVRSHAFTEYKKIKSPEIADDVKFWLAVINTVIFKDEALIARMRENESFTIAGFNLGFEKLSETLRNYNDSRMGYVKARNELTAALDKAYELYNSIFTLIIDLTDEQEQRLENAKTKYLPTAEDLNPNTRFVDNSLVKMLRENPEYAEYSEKHKLSWRNDTALMKSLLDKITKSEVYDEYMSCDVNDHATDCLFWRTVLKDIILPSDELAEALENRSVYWNDDLSVMGVFALKTIKQMSAITDDESTAVTLFPKYKDEEDERFGPELFELAVKNRELYRSYIDRFINSNTWDPERLAFMDIVIMITAIAELINYPLIPVPVTMNEYIEIANNYSTVKSGQFINGILYSVITYLKQEGILNK